MGYHFLKNIQSFPLSKMNKEVPTDEVPTKQIKFILIFFRMM